MFINAPEAYRHFMGGHYDDIDAHGARHTAVLPAQMDRECVRARNAATDNNN